MEDRVCTKCRKPESQLPTSLKRCAKCHGNFYCSRECQKADWKTHKPVCGEGMAAQGSSATAPKSLEDLISTFTAGSGIPISAHAIASNSFAGLDESTYLNDLSEHDAFATLIDAYRLRIEDNLMFGGDAGGLYDDDDPLPHFQRFLDKAETRDGVLPAWWSKEKRHACEKQAVRKSEWSCIYHAVEKSDIVERYDGFMPIRLRMLAERVYGKGVM